MSKVSNEHMSSSKGAWAETRQQAYLFFPLRLNISDALFVPNRVYYPVAN